MRIELRHLDVRRGSRTVLRDISWTVESGQRWVLLGANGAGKTQLLKLLAGVVWPVERPGSRRIYRLLGQAHDEPYGIKEQIAYVGAERQDRYAHYQWNFRVATVVGTGLQRSDIPGEPFRLAERRRVQRILARCHLAELSAQRFLSLSYGQRRLVLLARALAWRPVLLLLDEPLNGLDAEHRQRMLDILAALPRQLPVVLSTHRREDVPHGTTHVLELRAGRIARRGRWRPARRSAAEPTRAPPVRRARPQRGVAGSTLLLEARNASVWLDGRLVLRRLNFQVAGGQCWLVHGANGSGKTTLLRALYGDLGVASHGEIRRRGIVPGVPMAEFKRRVGLVSPELQTLHPLYLTALEVVCSGLHASIGLNEHSTAAERRRARAALSSVGAGALADRRLRTLSYGQLRRVLFARALVAGPALLLLDEPYTGLDAATRTRLRGRVERFLASHGTVIMCTHHRDDWPDAATHLLSLPAGSVRPL